MSVERLVGIISGGTRCLVEMRYVGPHGMRQEFHYSDSDTLPRRVREQGTRSDTFLGAAPRIRREGGKSAVAVAHCLWIDADAPEAVERLSAFKHAPTMTIASGTPGRLHAWWALNRPLSREWVERANRRLAHHLGADPRCAEAARIMRAPETGNWKTDPPVPVTVSSTTGKRYSVAELVSDLCDPPGRAKPAARPRTVTGDDDLASISPLDYFTALTGREVGADGKAQCLWHSGGNERTPSLHVYADAERGWTCFGCEKGGSIYDLGAALWGMGTRGEDFKALKERLAREMA